MPDADGRIKGIVVGRVYPGHRDYERPPDVDCPRCYAPAGRPCFDMRHGWDAWTAKGVAKLRAGWRPSYVRTKAAPHRERRS